MTDQEVKKLYGLLSTAQDLGLKILEYLKNPLIDELRIYVNSDGIIQVNKVTSPMENGEYLN